MGRRQWGITIASDWEANMTRLSTALRLAAAGLVAIAFAAAPSASQAASGRIQIEIVRAGFIVGVSGGSGTLTFKGKRYPLNIGGVSVGATVGASKAVLSGTVSNINSPADIAGTYGAAGAGLSVVSGARAARLRNAKGVVLEVRGQQTGLEFSADLSGMQIGLK
jgi:hypothetical protein